MDKTLVAHPQVLCWLQQSILDSHVATFLSYLRDRGYARRTQHSYICAVGHFGRWLTLEKACLPHLNEQVVMRFLSVHLPYCSCPYPVLRSKHEIHAALRHLLAMLRASGVIPQRQNSDPISLELARFDGYMLHVRGLAASTRRQRVRIVHKFLLAEQRGKHFDIGQIGINGVRAFVLSGHGKHNAGTVGVVGGALRCYLRFRALEGDNVEHLREAVPSAAHWRLAGVPELLSDQEVRNLLNSFCELKYSPKRAYAMVRCLTDLGLRASEVVQLRLDDIDWKKEPSGSRWVNCGVATFFHCSRRWARQLWIICALNVHEPPTALSLCGMLLLTTYRSAPALFGVRFGKLTSAAARPIRVYTFSVTAWRRSCLAGARR